MVLSHPEDVGAAHYTIIDNLKAKLENKLPRNSHEFMSVLAQELRESLCDEGDYECESMTYKHVISGMSFVGKINRSSDTTMSYIRAELPDDFDYEVDIAMENSIALLEEIHSMGHERVIYGMNNEIQKLKNSDTIIDETHRLVGISAISVGIESTKQWMEVLNDPEHIFYKVPFVEFNAMIHHDRNKLHRHRRLEDESVGEILGEVFGNITDIFGEFFGNLTDIFGSGNSTNIFDNLTDLLGGNVTTNPGGFSPIPIISKDILGASLGAVVGINKRKKKDGVIESTLKILSSTAASAVAGSVVGFFDSMAKLISCP